MNSITPAEWSYTEYARLPGSIADDEQGLNEAAKQFESLFINMWLKSAREANAALAEDSPFSSNELEMQQQMFDSQMAMHLAKEGGIGLAPTIVRQLRGGMTNTTDPTQQSTTVLLAPTENVRAADTQKTIPLANEKAENSRVERSVQASPPTTIVTQKSASRINLFKNPEEFVALIGPHIKAAMDAIGIPPLTVMAQAALETGWGKSVIADAEGQPSHNLFGVKGSNWAGPTVEIHSKEYLLGQWSDKSASFRAYPDWESGIADYAQTISDSERYGITSSDSIDSNQYADLLQKAGYATDPAYAQKLKNVMQRLTGLGF